MKCASQLLVNRNMFHRDNPDCFIDVNVLINKVPLKQANRWLLKLAAVDWGRGGTYTTCTRKYLVHNDKTD